MGSEEETATLEQKFAEETKELYNIPEPQRSEYVRTTIREVLMGAKLVAEQGNKISQARVGRRFIKELGQNMITILPCLFYTFKPEFREFYTEIMNEMDSALQKKE